MDDLISRQAAIDEAKEWIDAVYFEENDKRERKAIECFIGSLKNMPSAQPEKVCIANITLSEEQLREAVEKAKNEVVRVLLDERPTADVRKNVRGEWIEHKRAEEVEGYLISNYECSCCHTWERINSDYCPNCGADMRGERND